MKAYKSGGDGVRVQKMGVSRSASDEALTESVVKSEEKSCRGREVLSGLTDDGANGVIDAPGVFMARLQTLAQADGLVASSGGAFATTFMSNTSTSGRFDVPFAGQREGFGAVIARFGGVVNDSARNMEMDDDDRLSESSGRLLESRVLTADAGVRGLPAAILSS